MFSFYNKGTARHRRQSEIYDLIGGHNFVGMMKSDVVKWNVQFRLTKRENNHEYEDGRFSEPIVWQEGKHNWTLQNLKKRFC